MTAYSSKWDWLGISATSLCALHCLLLPALPFLALGSLAVLWTAQFETAVLAATLALAGVVLVGGYRHHRRRAPLTLLASAVVFYALRLAGGTLAEMLLMGVGAGCIVGAHALNLRYRTLADHAP